MPSSPEVTTSGPGRAVAKWNARAHYYLGLYFLFFIWLFAITGLLLNHGMRGMADFQRSRTTSKSDHPGTLSKSGTPLTDARDVMLQLQIEGEIQWLGTPGNANRFDFRVALQTDHKRGLGLIALGAGIVCCAWFVVGMSWFGN